jgi:hypothetical protein
MRARVYVCTRVGTAAQKKHPRRVKEGGGEESHRFSGNLIKPSGRGTSGAGGRGGGWGGTRGSGKAIQTRPCKNFSSELSFFQLAPIMIFSPSRQARNACPCVLLARQRSRLNRRIKVRRPLARSFRRSVPIWTARCM